MKHSIKISVMAFAAMFAFNMGANAQFGSLRGLANKAKKAVKEKVNDTKSSVQETATSTVSSQASEAGSEATSSSTA